MDIYRHQEFHNNNIRKQQQDKYRDFLDYQIKYRQINEPSHSNSVDKNNNNKPSNNLKNNFNIDINKQNNNKINNNSKNSYSNRI